MQRIEAFENLHCSNFLKTLNSFFAYLPSLGLLKDTFSVSLNTGSFPFLPIALSLSTCLSDAVSGWSYYLLTRTEEKYSLEQKQVSSLWNVILRAKGQEIEQELRWEMKAHCEK